MTHLLPGDLIRLIETPKEKVQSTLLHVGGLAGLAKALDSSLECGLDGANDKDLALRRDTFGSNFVPPPPPTTFLQLVWAAYKNLTLLVLTGAGILSLVLGFTVGGQEPTPRRLSDGDPATTWIEGFAILLAVTIVTMVTAVNNYQKEQQFRALSAIKDDEMIKAIRNGVPCEVGKHDLLVGDVVRIDVGDILSADGIVFEASELKVDESAMTGESVLIDKHPMGLTPFVLSGTKVMQGMGKMLVLAVGVSSQAGMISALLVGGATSTPSSRTMTQISDDDAYVAIATPRDDDASGDSDKMLHVAPTLDEPEESPMQGKLDALTILLGKFGITMALLVFLVLVARFSIDQYAVQGRSWAGTADVKEYLHFFIVGVTVLVVAIPEGLPLAVTISLSFSVKKMLLDNNLVRHLSACETMGSATTICSDKTGTLTTNQMTVMQCCIGDTVFDSPVALGESATNEMVELLVRSVAINSTAERVDGVFTGNKTECALLDFTAALSPTTAYDAVRRAHANMHILPFSSAKKRMSVVVPLTATSCRVYTKGASEIVFGLCSHMAFPDRQAQKVPHDVSFWRENIIQRFANDGLRTLCLGYKDIAAPWEHVIAHYSEDDLECDLTCVAIVGIEDPVRPDVPEAIRQCQHAGIIVRMVTGDNLATATSISKKCGILQDDADALVMEGAEFRRIVLDGNGQLKQDVFDTIWPRLRVLARSSPQDKYTLVSGIMASTVHGPQVVAVTGDGTNDAPALKKAHVGFAMGICGTAVSKDASDIILMDDNFKSIVNAVKWGRNVYDSVSKFLQFQLTVTFTAITLCVLGAIFLEETPLSAVQLLWVNLIMNTFASLALATDTPSNAVLDRKPYPRTKPLISKKMTKHILGHLVVQLAILLTLTLAGEKLLQIPSGRKYETEDPSQPSVHYTVVFNTFVFLQLFNEINARVIHDEKRVVLRGLLTNRLYASISVLQVVLQVIFVQFGGNAFDCAPLNGTQWAVCIGLGALSLPVGWSLRRIHSHHLPTWFALFRRAHPHSYLRFR